MSICEATNRDSVTFRAGITYRLPNSAVSMVEGAGSLLGMADYLYVTLGHRQFSTGRTVFCSIPLTRPYVKRAASKPKIGATERLAGSLETVFPELGKSSERLINERIRRMRR